MKEHVDGLSKDAAREVKEEGLDLMKEHVVGAGTGAPTILEPVRYAKTKVFDKVKGTLTDRIDEAKQEVRQEGDSEGSGILSKNRTKFTDQDRERED